MKTITLRWKQRVSVLMLGESITDLGKYINGRDAVIIIDKMVSRLYGHIFQSWETIEIDGIEKSKEFDEIKELYIKLLDRGFDRNSMLVGAGGGVVCDIAGFVASTYMRGVPFGFVPTTLLSQADASIGGKNGVNLNGYKNIIGTINQPEFILCDLDVLSSLSEEEFLSGMGEVIKHAVIGSPPCFSYLDKHKEAIMRRERESLFRIIYESIMVKKGIVEKDEFESDERRKLNFGHTFGHAIERETGISHGKAVCLGMKIALQVSHELGILKRDTMRQILSVINKYNPDPLMNIHPLKLFNTILKDKKRNKDIVNFIALKEIGKPVIVKIPIKDMKNIVNKIT